jgi:WD40 repeat protein
MSRIVRSSKFRHVFGTVAKREDCYDELKVTRTAWDSNYCAGNPLYVGVVLEAGGGGSFMVLPWKATGKVDAKTPMITGHKGPVLDIDFNPFNDNLVASASEDCTGKIWGIPEGGLKENMTEPLQTLNGHRRKVGTVKFSPTANNILATTSTDYSVKIWDIEKGKDVLSVDAQHTDIIQSGEWNRNGSLFATSCKDKKLRVLDPRSNRVAAETEGHQGVKGSRVVFLGMERLFSVGFTKTSEREFAIWDPRNLSARLASQSVDSASGLLMPFYDEDTRVLFLGGKGDGNIRYYEVVDEDPYIYYLAEFKSNTPQRGLSMVPKRAVSTSDCEIVKMLKVGPKLLEPISFQVPRKSDIFQDDIFPDCFSGEPALTADEWLSGKNAEPKTMSLAPGFVQKKTVVEFNPDKQTAPKELSEKELREENEKLQKRVAYLEAELIKRDAKIKELSG